MNPEKVGRYTIEGSIGGGGMALIYKARDLLVGRTVVLKVNQSNDPKAQARFIREINAAMYHHHAIVPVYDVLEHQDMLFMVMPWMAGGTLTQRIQKRALTLWEIDRILGRLASALAVLHSKGFLHRDVKPQNILFDGEDLAYLSDFGIAKPIRNRASDEPITQTHTLIGTPGYMSPEQILGKTLQSTSDIYSLGCVLFEMLTSEPLNKSNEDTLKWFTESIPDVLGKRDELPPACQDILEKSLAWEPGERHQNALELAKAFHQELEKGELHLALMESTPVSTEILPAEQNILTHPFTYEHPIAPQQFFGRARLLDDILQLIRGKQSVMISGLPHIGKSSLLLKLQERLERSTDSHFITNLIDLNQVAGDYEPKRFWERLLAPLQELTDEGLNQVMGDAQNNEFKPRFLKRIFWRIRSMNKQLVILVDNFERLLDHRGFKTPDFFNTLRGLLTAGDLTIVIASRLREQKMRQQARGLFDLGSVFFNPLHSKNLGGFSPESVAAWLSNHIPLLTEQDGLQVYQSAGHQPFLLQIMAATTTSSTQGAAMEQALKAHFEELWVSLENPVKGLLLTLVLIERQVTNTEHLLHNSPRNQRLFLPMLQEMSLDGLIRPTRPDPQLDEGRNGLLLDPKEWIIDAQRFTQWLHEYILIAPDPEQLVYHQWFNDQYENWINSSVWNQALTTLRRQGSGFSMYGTKYG
jgi:serine/threonine protein kinase